MTTSRPKQQTSNIDEGSHTPTFNPSEIWTIALEQVRLHISPQNFTAWFRNTGLTDIASGIAIVSCPSGYAREWLDTNHHKLVTNILRDITKQQVDVVFTVKTSSDSQGAANKTPASRSAGNDAAAETDAPDIVRSADRYANLSISPEEAPIFNIEYTHQSTLEDAQRKSFLNRAYLFENFVVGASNRLAHAAAEAVADNPGRAYNPLFVWGGVGLGKTHLTQAIGNRILNRDPNKKILYCSSETFLNEMIESIRNNRTSEFRQNYRRLDLLIIDDIQLISDWQKAQEELFHTFNILYQAEKQIVFISDRPPKLINNLTDRLRSRFEGGMVADITEPDYELRVAIVREKAEEKGIILPEHILSFIAKSVEANIRELEGALVRVGTTSRVSGIVPDENDVAKILQIDPASKRKKTSPKEIIEKVCAEFAVPVRDVRGKRRTADLVVPRQVCMYILRKELELPLERVARELNRGDHTTVLHAIERVETRMEEDEEFRDRVRGAGG